MAHETPPITLTFPSDLRMVAPARAYLEAICQTHQLDRQVITAILLATGEALTNIIRHGHRDKTGAQIHLQVQILPDRAIISLHDEGVPFDLEAVPHLNPGELRIGGRGVYLMRALMDELCCQPREAQGNVLRMVKRWQMGAEIRKSG